MAILNQDVGRPRPEYRGAAADYLRNLEATAGANRANPRVVAAARETLRTAPLAALLADSRFAADVEYLKALARRVAAGVYNQPPDARR